MKQYTRLRPHWRPTHDATPHGFAEWIGGDGANGWVKILNPDGHLVRRVWEVAPEAKILLRNHSISEQKTEMLNNPNITALNHAEFWDDWLYGQGLDRERHRVVVEGINEAPIWEPGYLEATVYYNTCFLRDCKAFGSTAGALQMNTGWPTNHGVKDAPPDWTPFEPVRQALLDTGGYLCLHEYWDARGPASSDWGWNPGRFTQLPDSWRGIPILITECGYDQAVNAPAGTPNHGYRGRIDDVTYMNQLGQYDDKLRESGWDVRAAFVFTHDWDEPWGTFDTVPLLNMLKGHAYNIRQLPPVAPPPRLPETNQPHPAAPPAGQGEETHHVQVLVDGRVVWSSRL